MQRLDGHTVVRRSLLSPAMAQTGEMLIIEVLAERPPVLAESSGWTLGRRPRSRSARPRYVRPGRLAVAGEVNRDDVAARGQRVDDRVPASAGETLAVQQDKRLT